MTYNDIYKAVEDAERTIRMAQRDLQLGKSLCDECEATEMEKQVRSITMCK